MISNAMEKSAKAAGVEIITGKAVKKINLDKYPDGMSLPSPSNIDFIPGQLLGCVSGELGLRKFLEDLGHTLVVMESMKMEIEVKSQNSGIVKDIFIGIGDVIKSGDILLTLEKR